ncbi:DsbE family thiol:disulfide interchange protein [Pseudovibrio sp. SPO723]|uniref:DsbE family thiol:disulfide interchange protein n=1 Tax=Nesiotobacter zosterae TaxID=392721 RepID=UPI0029C34114|nr:DsbE family thiol:disulfide interchange protein [Pseudovibrio sp. SPO723]MDX5595005.1 DsbE family thiol:disulfide interchange protein [Pseudovibrio sp. SPO723]
MSDNSEIEKPEPRRWSPFVLLPIVVFGALALLFFYQLVSGNDPQKLPSALIDKPAPEFVLGPVEGLMKDGKPMPGFAHEDLLGQVSVVNVFASWCAPCRAEHPYLMELSKDDRFQIAGLNYKDTDPKAVRFLTDLGNPYDRVGVDSGRVGIDWGVYGVPETFIVDREGQIRYKFVGPLDARSFKEVFLPELEKILSENAG